LIVDIFVRTDPMSGQALTSSELIPNISLRNAIHQLLICFAMMGSADADRAEDIDDSSVVFED
jgi:hypothetical protein